MPLDPLYFSPHEHTSHGDDGTTDLIGTIYSPDEVYLMKRFMAGQDRSQHTLFPESLEDYIAEDNPVRVVDVFVEGLDLAKQGFAGVQPEATGRPSYHPAVLLKLYIYGYLNRIQSVASAANSSCCVGGSTCSPTPSSPSTAANSRP